MPRNFVKHREETKKKISESLKKKFKSGYIRKHTKRRKLSEEHKKKLRESNKGQIPWNKGKKCPQISIALKGKRKKTYRRKIIIDIKSNYPLEFNYITKYKVKNRDCMKCVICKESDCRKLHIHHIDYDKTNCSQDNLITLCNSCHSKTNHNRDYWIDFFNNKKYVVKKDPILEKIINFANNNFVLIRHIDESDVKW